MTIHTFVQQEEVWKFTRTKRIGSWNQPNRRYIKGTKCQGLCNDNKGRWSIKLMTRWTTQDRVNSEIKLKIYSTMFLYSKEGQIFMIGIILQEIKLAHDKG